MLTYEAPNKSFSPMQSAEQGFNPIIPQPKATSLRLNTPIPFICRRPVRITIYLFLAGFAIWMVAWGVVPRLLDPTFEQHIKDKNVMVGMTREQVMDAWGSPYQMNVSYTDKGIRREEWIYEDWLDSSTIKHRYLYFEEGKLTGGWH